MEASPNEMQRRARAIWGYSGQEQELLAAAADVDPGRLKAWASRTRRANPTMPELVRLAVAAGIPRTFAERGFEALGQDEFTTRLNALEIAVRQLNVETAARDMEARGQLAEVMEAIRRIQPRPQP